MRRPFLAGIALAAVAVCLAVLVPAGSAHFTPGYYTHTTSNCANNFNRIDPISLVFYYRATPDRVGFHVQYHTGWSDKSGDGQWFKTHDSPDICVFNGTEWQRASGGSRDDRYHVRYANGYDFDATYENTVISSPHYETITYVGDRSIFGEHAVTSAPPGGFVLARNELYNRMVSGGHGVRPAVYWGNTEPRPQCDRQTVASDGYTYFVRVTVSGS